MMSRIIKALTGVHRLAEDVAPSVKNLLIKGGTKGGKIVGDEAVKGIKRAQKGAAWATGKFADFLEQDGPKKLKSNIGKFGGYVARDVDDTVKGINNIAGKATNGIEIKSWNKLRNNLFETNKYTGARSFQILKDDDNSILIGKKLTKGAATIAIGASAVMGVADGTKRKIQERAGTMTGVAGNAPVNNYAYQGASYADNAGATGDIVLNMHANRGSRRF